MPNRDHCCVPQCQNNRSKIIPGLTFHQFPSDQSLRKQWVVKIRRDVGKSFKVSWWRYRCHFCAHVFKLTYYLAHFQITNSTRVCSVHFKEGDFKTTLTGKRLLEKHAVPSVFCWSSSPRKRKSPKKREAPRARVRLFDVSVSSPATATATGKFMLSLLF